jgi:RyR domain/TrkA-N domain
MRVKLAEIGSELPLRYAVPFMGIIYAIGLYGFYQVCPAGSECGAGDEPFTFFNNALRTFGLFFSLAEPGHEALRNIPLMVARWIAPCITLFAIFRLFAERIDAWRKARSLARLQDHNVLIGVGESARHLTLNARSMVIVDRDPSAFEKAKPTDGLFTLTGDGRDAAVLNNSRVAQAKQVLIMGGSDSENLDMLASLSKQREGQPAKLRVAVRLKSAGLTEQLNREDQFVGMKNLDVFAFTLEQIAAQRFIAEHSFSEMAALRGQARVHVLIVGWSDFALAAMVQFLRVSPFVGLNAPRISVVCEDHEVVQAKIIQRYPLFSDRTCVDFKTLALRNNPTDQQILGLEKADPITAILIAAESDDVNAVAGLALRQQTHVANLSFAPIFVKLKKSTALDHLLQSKMGSHIDPAQSVISVAQTDESLSFENLFGFREALAKPFHDAYRNDVSSSIEEWGNLPATYRNANIAAADHTWARIASAGYIATTRTRLPHGEMEIEEPSVQMEQLAEITHRAWMIDRRLDGWRYGKLRDNSKLIHPSLRPYNELSEATKDLDRAQIRLLCKAVKQGEGATRLFREKIIAAFGQSKTSNISTMNIAEKTRLALSDLNAEYVTLVSALASDADGVIVDAVLDFLNSRKIPNRLLVLQSSPREIACILPKAAGNAEIVHLSRTEAFQWMAERADLALCHLRDGQKDRALSQLTKRKIKICHL